MKECVCIQCEVHDSRIEHYECPKCGLFGTVDEFDSEHEECLACQEAARVTDCRGT